MNELPTPLRVLFMGTADFAAEPLRALVGEHDVVGVFTRPDSVSRRGSKAHPSPVRELAIELGIGGSVHTPTSLRGAEPLQLIQDLEPDVIVVAAYGMLLPKAVLEMPALGCVNVHGSLLPRWRGAAPIERAILAGDSVSGVCIMRMEEGLDTGPTCACASTDVAGKSRDELTRELSLMGAELLLGSLEQIASGDAVWAGQDEQFATYAHKIEKGELDLAPTLTIDEAVRRVLASSAHAPSRLTLAGVDIVAQEVSGSLGDSAAPSDVHVEPGRVAVTRRGVAIGMSDGALLLTRVKPAGKGVMDATAWSRGARLPEGATWR